MTTFVPASVFCLPYCPICATFTRALSVNQIVLGAFLACHGVGYVLYATFDIE